MRREIILVANEGHTIPTTLAEKALKEMDGPMGVAFIEPEKGLTAQGQPTTVLLNDFEGHQKEWIKCSRIYHFATKPEKGEVAEDSPDIQPYVLLCASDENVVAA